MFNSFICTHVCRYFSMSWTHSGHMKNVHKGIMVCCWRKQLFDILDFCVSFCVSILWRWIYQKSDMLGDWGRCSGYFRKLIKNTWLILTKNSWRETTWFSGVVVVTTVQLHSSKPELMFCADSNPDCSVWEIRDGENLWQWSRLEIRIKAFR